MNKEEIAKSIDEGLKILKQEPNFVFNMEEIKAIEHFSNYPTNWNFCFEVDKRAIDIILGLISKLQKELDKKDKVIDLMAEYLNENNREFWTDDIEETKQYFYKKAEEEN